MEQSQCSGEAAVTSCRTVQNCLCKQVLLVTLQEVCLSCELRGGLEPLALLAVVNATPRGKRPAHYALALTPGLLDLHRPE